MIPSPITLVTILVDFCVCVDLEEGGGGVNKWGEIYKGEEYYMNSVLPFGIHFLINLHIYLGTRIFIENDIEFWIYPEHATNTCKPIKIQRLTIFGIAPLFIYFQLDKNSPIFCEGLANPKPYNACKASLFYLLYLVYLNVST